MMEFKFEVKDKSEVTDEEYDQLEWLRFRDGAIWPAFKKFPGFVALCKYNDRIIGWSFTFLKDSHKFETFYTYISKDYRRKGIATKLYQISVLFNDNENMNVSRWSYAARKFYESVGR